MLVRPLIAFLLMTAPALAQSVPPAVMNPHPAPQAPQVPHRDLPPLVMGAAVHWGDLQKSIDDLGAGYIQQQTQIEMMKKEAQYADDKLKWVLDNWVPKQVVPAAEAKPEGK